MEPCGGADTGGYPLTVPEGVWGPTVTGGSGRDWRRIGFWSAAAVVGVAIVVGGVAFALWRVAEGNLDRVALPALQELGDGPMNVLVVGSDSRQGLTEEQIRKYHLGTFAGQRGDTVILVSISRDQEHVSVVSFPRDLLVVDDGERRKLSETFSEGPDHVVEVLQEETGVPIHHYVEVSIPGFISVVEAVGGVSICLDEPLVDDKSGADFEAGCHDMTPAESLAYVRARHTARGDFDRIDRQQVFMRALLDRLISTRMLVDLPRLFQVVEQVSQTVTTDEGLGLGTMRALAEELRGLAAGDVPMVTVPSYPTSIDGASYVVPYDPGAEALYEKLREGLPLQPRGTKDARAEVDVAIWSAGNTEEAERAQRTLFWAAFNAYTAGSGPFDEPAVNSVLAAPGSEEEAGWVAAITGGQVVQTPPDVDLPDGAEVVVVTADRPQPELGVDRTVPEPRGDEPTFVEPSFPTAPAPEEPDETDGATAPPSESASPSEPSPEPSDEGASPTPSESPSSLLPTSPGPDRPDGDDDPPDDGTQTGGGAPTPAETASSPPPSEGAGT